MKGLYRDSGKENGSYKLGFRVRSGYAPWLLDASCATSQEACRT